MTLLQMTLRRKSFSAMFIQLKAFFLLRLANFVLNKVIPLWNLFLLREMYSISHCQGSTYQNLHVDAA